jgi:hypothetical protein
MVGIKYFLGKCKGELATVSRQNATEVADP